MQREQVSQRVDGHVDLGILLAFATATAARSLLSDVERSIRLCLTPRRQSQHRAQIVHHRLEIARRNPALRLRVHRRPRRQVVRHPSPRRTDFHAKVQSIEHLAQVMSP